MNIRQQKYRKNRVQGMDMYNAARAAGYSHTYATQACNRLEPKMAKLNDYFVRAGITNKKIAELLVEALEAEKVVSVKDLENKFAYEKDLRKKGRSGDIFALKNFGWSDKQDLSVEGDVKHQHTHFIETIIAKLDEPDSPEQYYGNPSNPN